MLKCSQTYIARDLWLACTGPEHQAGLTVLANMGATAGPGLQHLGAQHHQLKPASVVSVIHVPINVYLAKFLCLLVSLCHIAGDILLPYVPQQLN